MPAHETPALDRLLGAESERFADEVWGRGIVLASRDERGANDDFADLFSAAAVDELIADRGLRTPFLRVAREGTTLPDSAFTSGGGVGAGVGDQVSDDKLRRLFADGATIVLQGLHRTWPPLLAFGQQLAAELGHPVQVNAYVTPPQNQGFSDHYDVHDVFVLQVHGQKRWAVRPPVLESPLRGQTWDARRADVERAAAQPPLLEVTLNPGDCLYLPRGFVHSARARGGTSIHLTIGVHVWTRDHLAESLLRSVRDALADDPGIRASLPLGVDIAHPDELADAAEAVRTAAIGALTRVDTATLAADLLSRHRGMQRPEPLAPLAQLSAADALEPGSRLRLRAHLLASLEDADGGLVVRSRAGRCQLPAEARPALERLLTGQPIDVASLADDAQAAVRLARRLLVEGVAVIA